ncbi:hypothetical protein [Marinobacter sp. CA1]|uniref:hypothetical protein n=1 Tax=Marinobacter sp. CA1 TaxID=2817656 RepID=UPI001D07BDBC|nr:hypothetical protein [Marinobacter sp. CA1]UDL06386.1 hypothetical protein J2887_06385 [Marinobacter sp. CA1]
MIRSQFTTLSRTLLLSASLFLLPFAQTHADSRADRLHHNDGRSMANPVEQIHRTYGPTAAGPAKAGDRMMKDAMMEDSMASDTMAPDTMDKGMGMHHQGRHHFPMGVDTAYERKRFLFDNNY